MAPKTILIRGIGADATEEEIASWLGQFGPVEHIDIVRDGNPDAPVALVAMNIGQGAANYVVSRLTCYWHEGRLIKAYLMIH